MEMLVDTGCSYTLVQEELEKLQSEDETLSKIRSQANGTMENPPGVKYVRKDGLMYRVWGADEEEKEQLVLPGHAGKMCYG